MKRIRCTVDAHGTRLMGVRTRDDRLDAIPPGKVLCTGTVWTGSLKPLVDATVEALEPLVTGFTSGQVLHAEGPSGVLDLGRVWAGRLDSQIRDTAERCSGDAPDVDVTEVLREVAAFRAAIGGTPVTFASAADSLRRLKGAAAAVDSAVRRGVRSVGTGDGRHPMLASNRHLTFGGSGGATTGGAIRKAHRELWNERDRLDGRYQGGVYASQTRDTVAPPELRSMSVSPGVTLSGLAARRAEGEDMNARAADFWGAREAASRVR